jgi:hypothetical protein
MVADPLRSGQPGNDHALPVEPSARVKVAAIRARSATLIDPLRTLIDRAAANSVMTQSLISSVSGSCRPQPVLHAAGGGARERRHKHRRIKVSRQ